jgi:hypothetical protein
MKAARGGPDQNRTDDLLIANEALSQLSYGPIGAMAADYGFAEGPLSRAALYRRRALP